MDREQVVALIKRHERELRAQGVTTLSLFGSTARGDARPDSDVDVLVDVDPNRTFSLLDLCGVRLYLSDVLGREADVLIRDDLKPELRVRIAPDEARVF